MTRPPSRPLIEIAAPTTSPDALSLASADNAPGFARSVCKARFRSKPVAVWSIAAIASTLAQQAATVTSTSALTHPLSALASATRRLVIWFVTP